MRPLLLINGVIYDWVFMIGCYHPSVTDGHLAYGVGVLIPFAYCIHIPGVAPRAWIYRPSGAYTMQRTAMKGQDKRYPGIPAVIFATAVLKGRKM